jgi:hypothetical protein
VQGAGDSLHIQPLSADPQTVYATIDVRMELLSMFQRPVRTLIGKPSFQQCCDPDMDAPLPAHTHARSADWVRYTGFEHASADALLSGANFNTPPLTQPRHPAAPPAPYWPTEERNFTVADFDLLLNFM